MTTTTYQREAITAALKAFEGRPLAARRAHPTADISALERQVDEMVATLYGTKI